MKPQFQHEANTSFALWLDHYIGYKGESFSNKSAELYYTPDERMENYPEDYHGFLSYNSEYKQWVYDSSLNGAEIPSGVHIDTGDGRYNFCQRGESGLTFDFDNGRVLLSGMYFEDNFEDLKIKADFAVKDVNIYLSNESEDNLIFENKFNVNSRTIPDNAIGQGLPAYEQVTPAAFISMENSYNEPYAFGGEDLTELNYRVVFFMEDLYQLDGVLSMCTDAKNLGICNLGYDHHPFNEYGDLKSGSYNYANAVNYGPHRKSILYIEDVRASKITDRYNKSINPQLYLGFVDFKVSQARYPRV